MLRPDLELEGGCVHRRGSIGLPSVLRQERLVGVLRRVLGSACNSWFFAV